MTTTSIRLPLEEYFKYHPVVTPERQERHDLVNKAALDFALTIEKCVEDDELYKMCVYAIQQARMLANQGITLDELRKLEAAK